MAKNYYFNLEELKNTLSEAQLEDCKHLQLLLLQENPKIAVHDDPDGIISGLLLKNYFIESNPIIIPISYRYLRQPAIYEVLREVTWFCIADLPPFNIRVCEYYFDHHYSSKDTKMRANNIFYNPDAPSAAKIIVDNLDFKNKQLIHLSHIATIIDKGNLAENDPVFNVTIPETIEEEAWLLEDIVFSRSNFEELLEIIDLIDEYKEIKPLFSFYEKKISFHRQKRKKSVKIAKNVECEDVIILLVTTNRFSTITIINELRKRNVKVILALVKSSKSKYNLIARQSFKIDKKEGMLLRLDTLAEKFGGGGHIAAAGAQISDVQEAIYSVEKWAEKLKMRTIIYELREKGMEEII